MQATAGVGAAEELLRAAGSADPPDRVPPVRRLLAVVAVAALLLVAAVAVAGLAIAHRLAESESVDAAARTTDLIAEAVVDPALARDAGSGPGRFPELAAAVRAHVLSDSLVRVKLWASDGRILWSDDPRLVGRRFRLGDEEREVLEHPRTEAEVSDASAPENVHERGSGPLLEVYRPVRGPHGERLLFEAYFRAGVIDDRATSIWTRFAAVTLGSIAVVLVGLLLLLRGLLGLLGRARGQREAALRRAVDASEAERRRIAADLHDGVVQDLVGTSFTLAAAAERADGRDAEVLRGAARRVRSGVAGLRSLLVDIYPPALSEAGIEPALRDLAAGLAGRGVQVDVRVELQRDDRLPDAVERLLFRVAHELLQNAAKHAGVDRVDLVLRDARAGVELVVADEGRGFDPAARGAEGHFGLRLLDDLVRDSGTDARLLLRTAPGEGTTWRLVVRR